MSRKPFFSASLSASRATSANAFALVFFIALGTSLISFAAWITHVVVCIRTAEWGYLIAGAIAFPVGVVHGVGIWFGWWS